MIRDVHQGSRILVFFPSWITDLGVKKAADPGSGFGTLQTAPCYDAGEERFRRRFLKIFRKHEKAAVIDLSINFIFQYD